MKKIKNLMYLLLFTGLSVFLSAGNAEASEPSENLALGLEESAYSARTSHSWYPASWAFDGNPNTFWAMGGTGEGYVPGWVEVDFGEETAFNHVIVSQNNREIVEWSVQISETGEDNGEWTTVVSGTGEEWSEIVGYTSKIDIQFDAVSSRYVRFYIETMEDEVDPAGIWEFEIYNSPVKNVDISAPQSYQIFQRNEKGTAEIPVKGRVTSEQDVDLKLSLLDLNGESVEGIEPIKADVTDGEFEERFTNVPAGLYQIQITGEAGETVEFEDTIEQVGVGDLWIIAGQSNAAGYGQYIPGEEVDSADDDPPMEGVNLYRWDSKSWCLAEQPIGEAQSPSNHGPGLAFAKEISKAENVPIGIVQVAVGGSSITSWMKGGVYYNRILNCFDDQGNPSAKGIFWYQGEAETLAASDGSIPEDNVNAYAERYTQMVKDLRQDLNNPDLAVITAQLNSHADRDQRHPAAALWYQMKEIQRQLGTPGSDIYVPGTAVISTSDLILSDGIHNSANSNVILAKRMAKAALATAYGEDVSWGQPGLRDAVAEERTVTLTFDNVEGALKAEGTITDFTIRDDAGEVPIERTEINGKQIEITVTRDFAGSVKVDGLASIRPEPTVFNQRNEPILAFYDVPVTESDDKVSKNTLEYFLNSAKEHVAAGDVENCIESVRNLFDEAIAEGDAVMADEEATREEVMSATVKLMKAIQSLDMKAGNKTDLEMAVELGDMIDLSKYVEAGQQEFADALAAAKEVLADGDAMQEEIDSAWNALVDAMSSLRLKANKDVLEALLNEAAGLDLSQYTEESVSVFRSALASAQAVLADGTLSENDQQTVDEAVTALKSAKDGLTAKADNAGSGNDGNNNGQDDSQTGGNTGNAGNGGDGSKTDNKTVGDAASQKAAKTGDETYVIWLLILLAAVSGGAAVVIRKSKG